MAVREAVAATEEVGLAAVETVTATAVGEATVMKVAVRVAAVVGWAAVVVETEAASSSAATVAATAMVGAMVGPAPGAAGAAGAAEEGCTVCERTAKRSRCFCSLEI